MDDDEIESGGELEEAIRSAIHKCSVFVLISSRAAIQSDYVQKEVIWALEEKMGGKTLHFCPSRLKSAEVIVGQSKFGSAATPFRLAMLLTLDVIFLRSER